MDSQEEVEWCDKEKSNGNGVRFSLVDFVKEEGLTGSSYFIIKKYVPHHSCAPSIRNGSVRTGDTFDCMVDLVRRTCSCEKFDLMKIPCRHAIKAGFSVGIQAHTLTDDIYTTASWHTAYEESINLIGVPEDAWTVPSHVEQTKVLPPKSRRAAGRRKKRRYETAEDKIRSSQGNQGSKGRKCSRCGIRGHDRRTCDRAI
uniref:SWIM-type domain-containing protein n=1 Tax=Brassica oleracea var. oleracea TaxID=109376 RepID=A0A0D3A5J8_BRAOL